MEVCWAPRQVILDFIFLWGENKLALLFYFWEQTKSVWKDRNWSPCWGRIRMSNFEYFHFPPPLGIPNRHATLQPTSQPIVGIMESYQPKPGPGSRMEHGIFWTNTGDWGTHPSPVTPTDRMGQRAPVPHRSGRGSAAGGPTSCPRGPSRRTAGTPGGAKKKNEAKKTRKKNRPLASELQSPTSKAGGECYTDPPKNAHQKKTKKSKKIT